ncbi:MAG: 50S ribosomal protein L17 [Candidatus Omnitrophota bacterium]
MRHGLSGNRLGRKSSHRKATIRDIAKATLIRERIRTTLARAKEARKLVDRLITLGKKGTLAHRRMAFAVLCDHKLVSQLFEKISPRFKKRMGGYTRIIPLSFRRGDNARLAYLELTEKEKIVLSKSKLGHTAKKEHATATAEDADVRDGTMTTGTKEQKVGKPDPIKVHPTNVVPSGKEKIKLSKKAEGGIRRMFRKTTPEG